MMIEQSREWSYGWYAIQVFARYLEDGKFQTHGWIRHAIRNPAVQEDLPYEYKFNVHGERHPNVDAALKAGLDFAIKRIEGLQPKGPDARPGPAE